MIPTQKKSLKTFIIVFVVIVLFLLLPPLYVWLKGGSFQISATELRYSIYIAIITPFLMWLSRKVKHNLLFVVLALAIISVGAVILNLIFKL